MKVCLISRSNGRSGGYSAAYRLYQGLQDTSLAVSMLVGDEERGDKRMITPQSFWDKSWLRLSSTLDKLPQKWYKQPDPSIYSLQWLPDRLYSKIKLVNPDIINLHWVQAGFMQIETLRKIKQPIVWTLHDMWVFTGGCHYSSNCQRYQKSCGKCPQLGSQKEWDLSYWTWQKKQKNWSRLNLSLVTPSRWLADCARQSSLFSDLPIHVIPNGINPQVYRPIDQKTARHLLNLPQDKQFILFGSMNPDIDKRKGIHLLLEALAYLQNTPQAENIEAAVFGNYTTQDLPQLGIKVRNLGTFKDDLSLAIAYNAANLFVAPSLEDNLPNTVMEALACGVPCVAFNIGGMPDMIDHQVNGYLAKPYDVTDLAQGVLWILENSERWAHLSAASRSKVECHFTIEKQASAYHTLFQNLNR
ncbi:MAG: glycosyltransferase family 4 protein [Microcystaceae cyanobacterium]